MVIRKDSPSCPANACELPGRRAGTRVWGLCGQGRDLGSLRCVPDPFLPVRAGMGSGIAGKPGSTIPHKHVVIC